MYLEDMPEFRDYKYFKYRVIGHTYKEGRYKRDFETGKCEWIHPEVTYPTEEFDNIEDARKCKERFKKMPYAIPEHVEIRGFYQTLCGADWELVF